MSKPLLPSSEGLLRLEGVGAGEGEGEGNMCRGEFPGDDNISPSQRFDPVGNFTAKIPKKIPRVFSFFSSCKKSSIQIGNFFINKQQKCAKINTLRFRFF